MFVLRWLCRLHDALTDVGFVIGAVGLLTLVVVYCYEVVTRYLLDLATDWANDTFSNVLCITIFAMVPHATRRGMHISITLLVDMFPGASGANRVFSGLLGFAVCLVATWMSLEANIRQVVLEIVTEQNHPIPKIYMSAFITYGFASAGLYFLRSIFTADSLRPRSWVVPAPQQGQSR